MSLEEDMRKYEETLFGKAIGQIPDHIIKKFKEDATKNLRYSLERDRIIDALTYKKSLTSVVV